MPCYLACLVFLPFTFSPRSWGCPCLPFLRLPAHCHYMYVLPACRSVCLSDLWSPLAVALGQCLPTFPTCPSGGSGISCSSPPSQTTTGMPWDPWFPPCPFAPTTFLFVPCDRSLLFFCLLPVGGCLPLPHVLCPGLLPGDTLTLGSPLHYTTRVPLYPLPTFPSPVVPWDPLSPYALPLACLHADLLNLPYLLFGRITFYLCPTFFSAHTCLCAYYTCPTCLYLYLTHTTGAYLPPSITPPLVPGVGGGWRGGHFTCLVAGRRLFTLLLLRA